MLERAGMATGVLPRPSTIRAAPDLWGWLAQCTEVASALFLTVFLVISLVALHRARAQDVPETIRALAQLLHPRARTTSSPGHENGQNEADHH